MDSLKLKSGQGDFLTFEDIKLKSGQLW